MIHIIKYSTFNWDTLPPHTHLIENLFNVVLARVMICDESPPKRHLQQRLSLEIAEVEFLPHVGRASYNVNFVAAGDTDQYPWFRMKQSLFSTWINCNQYVVSLRIIQTLHPYINCIIFM